MLTWQERYIISKLWEKGIGFKTIARELSVARNTVKSFIADYKRARNAAPDSSPVKYKCDLMGPFPYIPEEDYPKVLAEVKAKKEENAFFRSMKRY